MNWLRILVAIGIVMLGDTVCQAEIDPKDRAYAVLKKHCLRCHGDNGSAEGGLQIHDATAMARVIKPGQAAKSVLYQRMTNANDPMPPTGPRPTAAEMESVKAWIDSGAAALVPPVDRPFISLFDQFEKIARDLDTTPPERRKFKRYLSLVHLANAGVSDDELNLTRLAVIKMVNSLSRAGDPADLKPIDSLKLIYRLDLESIGWQAWQFDRVIQADPFAIVLDNNAFQSAAKYTETPIPVVRADVFVYLTSRGHLYYDLLKIPSTLNELARNQGIDLLRNLERDSLIRVGFAESGVAINPRIFERHGNGLSPFWLSYDFANNIRRQNFFAFPIGPALAREYRAEFTPDGSEVIFGLPNGLLAYGLFDGRGKRVDEAAINIVHDDNALDRTVRAGISCFRCHAQGYISKADEVLAHTQSSYATFDLNTRRRVTEIYRSDKVNAAVQADSLHYQLALKRMGLPISKTDPITLVSQRFERALDQRMAAAEVGMPLSDYLKAIVGNQELAQRLASTQQGGVVQRNEFVDLFPLLAREANPGLIQFASTFKPGHVYTYTIQDHHTTYTLERSHILQDGIRRYSDRYISSFAMAKVSSTILHDAVLNWPTSSQGGYYTTGTWDGQKRLIWKTETPLSKSEWTPGLGLIIEEKRINGVPRTMTLTHIREQSP